MVVTNRRKCHGDTRRDPLVGSTTYRTFRATNGATNIPVYATDCLPPVVVILTQRKTLIICSVTTLHSTDCSSFNTLNKSLRTYIIIIVVHHPRYYCFEYQFCEASRAR